MFGKKKKAIERAERYNADLQRIVEDYILCTRYFYNGAQAPVFEGFKDDDCLYWLKTDMGLFNLDTIPHDNLKLTECLNEIECLVADNGFSVFEIITKLNEEVKNKW